MRRFITLAVVSLFLPSLALAQEVAAQPPASPTALELVIKYLGPPAVTAVAGLLTWAFGLLVGWAKTKRDTSKLAYIGLFLGEAAQTVVAELEATLVPLAKAAMEDGKLTPEEGARIKAVALDLLKTKLPPAVLSQAKGLMGPFLDTFLSGLIERANAAPKPVTTLEQAAAVLRGPQPA